MVVVEYREGFLPIENTVTPGFLSLSRGTKTRGQNGQMGVRTDGHLSDVLSCLYRQVAP